MRYDDCPRGGTVYTADLKSAVERHIGSSPIGGTNGDCSLRVKPFSVKEEDVGARLISYPKRLRTRVVSLAFQAMLLGFESP